MSVDLENLAGSCHKENHVRHDQTRPKTWELDEEEPRLYLPLILLNY